ncbi:MAG: type I glutamate--ammonia ligase [Nitrososphaerota archaeon]|nr:type I glutamate--ammonia ligase [Nitrososphaerota archaeon]MDG6959526.1 type I glutamate--ammonia ligase [Nitrososphaerota archaeon]MDG6961480.1 type I glutamate--ammonia ligase [Nitrososphaerota archaeon]MDG6965968.1 type I glutamate--ammonia ligase [Nitrososphaerota archaeon]MDG7015242.1 type I glutamate--ammonia ligase [Nitrososphaerota archaeon]
MLYILRPYADRLTFHVAANGEFAKRTYAREEVLGLLGKEEVKFVDLQFTDVPGRLRHVTLPTEMMNEGMFSDGVAKLDGSSVRGFVDINESDMLLVPDPSTYGVFPWTEGQLKTARLICDVRAGYGRGRFARDPRHVAQVAEQKIREAGFTDSLWGPEVEFFVFDAVTWEANNPFSAGFKISSRESAMESRGTNFPIRFKDGYYPAEPVDTLSGYRGVCVNYLRDGFGILSNAHHHEVATAGQCEIDIYRDELVTMADSTMTYKFVTKNVASRMGMIATTMPKPIFGDNAVGMHVHSSLWKGGKNAFFDPADEYAELSQTARYYIGGIMAHSRALCAIVAPTTNSYHRLVPGYEAPVYIAWSKMNRSANVRIPAYEKGSEGAKRIEFRTPDPSCNPYLAFAAITAAGLEGVRNKTDPGDPVDQDIYKLTPAKRREMGVGELPGSLKEAVESLYSDSSFLDGIFPRDLVEVMMELEMEAYRSVAARPHPYEFNLYFDL